MFSNGIPATAANTVYVSPVIIPGNFMEMKLSEFIKLSAKDFSSITGKKMSLKEKISFSLLKKHMKKSLKSNPDQTVTDYLAAADRKSDIILIVVILLVVLLIVGWLTLGSIDVGPILGG